MKASHFQMRYHLLDQKLGCRSFLRLLQSYTTWYFLNSFNKQCQQCQNCKVLIVQRKRITSIFGLQTGLWLKIGGTLQFPDKNSFDERRILFMEHFKACIPDISILNASEDWKNPSQGRIRCCCLLVRATFKQSLHLSIPDNSQLRLLRRWRSFFKPAYFFPGRTQKYIILIERLRQPK